MLIPDGLGHAPFWEVTQEEAIIQNLPREQFYRWHCISTKQLTNLTKCCPSNSESHSQLLDFI